MPQWDFLNFLASQARQYPTFHLMMDTEVSSLINENGRVAGVRADSPSGPLEIRADLVVGTDGRGSLVRELAGLSIKDLGAPIDVLWMKIPRIPSETDQPMGRFEAGRILAMLYRGDYWQCAFVIPKGGYEQIRARGLASLHDEVLMAAPFLGERVKTLKDWDDVKLLTVKVDRLRQWFAPGVLCIGDAAHAMSPIGGVGINLAIQDAVAAANALAGPLKGKSLTLDVLRRVQRRREFPTRVTQRIQIIAQDRIIKRVLNSQRKLQVPFIVRLGQIGGILPRLAARVIGLGVRPEHIRAPNAFSAHN